MKKKLCLTMAILALASAGASACSVPVFRYALERWFADPYPVFLMHDNVNTSAVVEAEAFLEEYEEFGAVYVRRVNLSDPKIKEAAEKRQLPTDGPLPRLVVTLPEEHHLQHVVVNQEINEENLKALIDSPVRRELARRLIDADSAVWLLLESGDKAKDDAAEKVIQEQLDIMTEELELPEIAPQDMKYLSVPPESLQIKFSIMRLSRDDPNETLLLEMLLNSEPDLEASSGEPIVFPVFGRGRELFALAGEGINADNISQACYFLTGSCSCEIKSLNPGMDLLIAVNWFEYIDNLIGYDEDMPPLTGYAEFVPVVESTNTVAEVDEVAEEGSTGNPLARNLIIVVVLVIGVMAFVTKRVLGKK